MRRRKRGGSKNWEAPAPSIQTYSRIRMIDQDQNQNEDDDQAKSEKLQSVF